MKKKVLAGMLALAMCLSACTPKSDPEETGLFKAGTYTAEAQGMNGAVKVEVVFTADRIETVTVTDHAETAGIKAWGWTRWPAPPSPPTPFWPPWRTAPSRPAPILRP